MSHLPALRFAAVARHLADEARRHALVAPSFRSPPRMAGARRTIQRYGDGSVVIAVLARGREADEVVADMIEGVVVANGLRGPEATDCRLALAAAIDDEVRGGLSSAGNARPQAA